MNTRHLIRIESNNINDNAGFLITAQTVLQFTSVSVSSIEF